MVAQGFGITLLGAASQRSPAAGVTCLPITDESEPVVFSAVWLPQNRSASLRNLFRMAAGGQQINAEGVIDNFEAAT